MTDKAKKNPAIGILILVGIAIFIYGFNTLFGVDFENPDSVKKGMQGTWVVHEHDNGDWIHARLTVTGDTYKFRFAVTDREKFNEWNGLPVTEGTFEIRDIKTYTNTTTEYRPIAFMGTTLESSIASRKIFFDKSMGLYWGQWGEMKEDDCIDCDSESDKRQIVPETKINIKPEKNVEKKEAEEKIAEIKEKEPEIINTPEEILVGFFVIGFNSKDSIEANNKSQMFNRDGYKTSVIYSSHYSNLSAGWYVVIFGVYNSMEEAKNMQNELKGEGVDCYSKFSGKIKMNN